MYAAQTLWERQCCIEDTLVHIGKGEFSVAEWGQRGDVHAQNVKEKGAQARAPAASVSHILEVWP